MCTNSGPKQAPLQKQKNPPELDTAYNETDTRCANTERTHKRTERFHGFENYTNLPCRGTIVNRPSCSIRCSQFFCVLSSGLRKYILAAHKRITFKDDMLKSDWKRNHPVMEPCPRSFCNNNNHSANNSAHNINTHFVRFCSDSLSLL